MARLADPNLTRDDAIVLCVRYNVPIHNAQGLVNYFQHHIVPGSFLLALLSNDLKTAAMYADDTNKHHLWDITNLLYNEAPNDSWGSPKRTTEWIAARMEATVDG